MSTADQVDALAGTGPDRPREVEAPLVSIGVPAFNGGDFVRAALESLRAQDYANLEILVSDDGSTDGTLEICSEFARSDRRIRVVSQAHLGARQNFNHVLALARGPYFMWAADHDLWSSQYVSACVAALDVNPTAVLAYAHTMLIDRSGNFVGMMDDQLSVDHARPLSRYRELIWRLSACNAIYGLMRRDALIATGGYGRTPSPDHLVLAKMALQGLFIQLPGVMYFRRDTRPEEVGLEQWRRQPSDLDPENAADWLAKGKNQYFRTLRDGHIRAVARSEMSVPDKLSAVLTTVACFRIRFGVSSWWVAIGRRLALALPAAVRGRLVGWRLD